MELPKSVSDLMMDNIQECVVLYDSQGCVVWANNAFEERTGYKPSEVVGKNFGFLKSGIHHPNMYGDVWYKIVSGITWHGDIIERDKYGALYPVTKTIIPLLDDDNKRFYLSISIDISRQEQIKERLVFFDKHDRLTGLLTRSAFLSEIDRMIQRSSSRRQTFAMALLDISGLDRVNELMGFNYCDQLIKSIIERIKRKMPSGALLSRLGSNEFGLAFLPHDHISQIMSAITGIIRTISLMSVDTNGYDLQLGVKIGMSLYPEDSRNAEELMLCAQRALQKAVNDAVANTYVMFTKDIGAEMEDVISLERDLRRGLAADEFELFLQPQVDIVTEKIVGAEALIRWFHPTRGVIAPGKFISLAENNGMIVELGEWVLQEALRQMRGMDGLGVHLPVVSVNVSAMQFQRPDFITSVLKSLGYAGLDSRRLELEVTESCLMQDTKMSAIVLHRLKLMNIGLAIDDFGTGYSSLNYLKDFPVDRLKIDQSFYREIVSDKEMAIVKTIINLGHNLGMKTMAEGVEREDQLNLIRQTGCDGVQGYYFGRPMPVNQFIEFMRSYKK